MTLHNGQKKLYKLFNENKKTVAYRPVRWGKTFLLAHIAVEQINKGKVVYIGTNEHLKDEIDYMLSEQNIKYRGTQILMRDEYIGKDVDVCLLMSDKCPYPVECKKIFRLCLL